MEPLNSTQPAHESTANTPADDVLNLLEQVESQFERIRELRRSQDETVKSLASRTEDLDAREAQFEVEQDERQVQRDAAIDALEAQANHQLDAICAARSSLARRGRRLRQVEQIAQRTGADRARLRRRLRGLRQAVRRLLKDGQRLQESARLSAEQHDGDQHTITLQNERLRLATEKMRLFSSLLKEQTERLERGAAAMMEVDALRSRLEESKKQQQLLQDELDSASAMETPLEPVVAPEFQERLQKRKERLHRCRQLLQHRAKRLPQMAQLEASRRRQETQLLEQQRHLDDVRRVLSETETRMIRRWAGTRATQIIGWISLLILLIGCGSWWAANRFDPPVRRAAISLEAQSPTGDQLEPELLDAWATWHTELLGTTPFAERFAARLQERGVRGITSAESVRGFLSEGININRELPGQLRVTTDVKHGAEWLDAMALVMSTESARTVRSRPGPVVARIDGRHLDDGRVRFATYGTAALSDTRWRTAMLVFVMTSLMCLLLGVIIYVHLARVRHVFDDSLTDMQGGGTPQ